MTALLTLVRALRHRAGMTLVVLAVALCATAAATVGPTYYVAAKHSILQDTLADANVIARGFQAVQQGAVQGTLAPLDSALEPEVDRVLGGAATTRRLFAPPVFSMETTVSFPQFGENPVLAWRSDVCAHLHFAHGHCPANSGEVAVSTSLAADNHWTVGQRITPAARRPLTIAGIYAPPDATTDYWFGRGTTYFPAEQPTSQSSPFDALFTPRATIDGLSHNPQGSVVIARSLVIPHVQPADVDALGRLDTRLNNGTALRGAAVTTGLAATTAAVHASWSSLAVPVVVITAELLVLTWLLLFLVVTDAVEARGTEIALAKLRGYGAGRALLFGLGEPVSILAAALPLGALVGWAATGLLSAVLLRAGTPVGLPGLGWVGAAVATLGGVAAVLVAARGTVTRPVVEQWRRTGRHAAGRGWLLDGIVVTGAVAGLVQLIAAGSLSSASHSALALLVPGLLGLAIAVVGSRLLPLGCRGLFARTRRSGGLGPFLAMRHIVRRPGGTRTTMILATAMALATFSLCVWSVGTMNRARVAQVTIGAPTVLTVAPIPGFDLPGLVDRLDPTGRHAAVVESLNSGSATVLAVQPQRFAAVAHWGAVYVGDPGRLLSGLHPPAPDPVVLTGDKVRVHLHVSRLNPAGGLLSLDVVAPQATAPTPVGLGTLTKQHTTVTRVGDLPGSPSVVSDIEIAPPTPGPPAAVAGAVTVTGIEVHGPHGWTPVAGATDPSRWADVQDQQVHVQSVAGGLSWSFFASRGTNATLATHDRPASLPAIVARPVAGGNAAFDATGLDAGPLPVQVEGLTAAVPGAIGGGLVVDLTYAERAAFGNTGAANVQVWVRGDPGPIRRGLAAAHVPVLATQSSSAVDNELSRQGPGLASVLFLADAAAAAVLAALAAVLSLSAAARRRRYEYAALSATGASSRTLFAALAIEQLVVVGFGALVGVGAGLLSFVIAGHSVPEFVAQPLAVLLAYRPSAIWLAAAVGGGVILMLAAATLAAAALLRSVSADQLREAPS